MWKLRINTVPISGNVLMRMHWSRYRKVLLGWFMLVRGAHGFLDIPKATGKRRVTIQVHGKRSRDFDNAAMALKPLFDVLRPAKHEAGIYQTGKRKGQAWTRDRLGHGLLVEDDPRWVERVIPPVVKLKAGERPWIEIILEDIA